MTFYGVALTPCFLPPPIPWKDGHILQKSRTSIFYPLCCKRKDWEKLSWIYDSEECFWWHWEDSSGASLGVLNLNYLTREICWVPSPSCPSFFLAEQRNRAKGPGLSPHTGTGSIALSLAPNDTQSHWGSSWCGVGAGPTYTEDSLCPSTLILNSSYPHLPDTGKVAPRGSCAILCSVNGAGTFSYFLCSLKGLGGGKAKPCVLCFHVVMDNGDLEDI